MVQAALATGCRYGDIIRMSVSDFNPEAGVVSVRLAKGGKVRHVALADEGRALFTNLTAGRAARGLIFRRADGQAWGPSHQQRPPNRSLAYRSGRAGSDVSRAAPHLRLGARDERCSNGRHRCSTRALRHQNDRKALCPPRAVIRCRHGSSFATSVGRLQSE